MPASDSNPVVLVTGAAQRVGAVIARSLHAAGYDLALHYRHSAAAMTKLCAELEAQRPGSTLALQAELTDPAAAEQLIAASITHFGHLDGLVNNAAMFHATPLATATHAQWREFLATNAEAPFFLAQAAAPALTATHGSIVNIVDVFGERPLPGHAVYSISKAAALMVTRTLAVELAPAVRVNAVAPGTVLWSTNETRAETPDTLTQRTALGHIGSPEDVAAAVLYLLRDARYTTGAVLPVDGGRHLTI